MVFIELKRKQIDEIDEMDIKHCISLLGLNHKDFDENNIQKCVDYINGD